MSFSIRRSDIFYVHKFGVQVGSEEHTGRPGVVVSCDGKLRRVASKTYIVAPGLVDLSGELVDGMDGGGLYM